MAQPTLALIHTTPVNLPSFRDLAAEHLSGIRVINILDDSLLADVMAAEAVRLVRPGGIIGVLATVQTTLDPTANLIRRTAEREGKAARVDAVLVEGAYEALRAGNGEEHDRRVGAALQDVIAQADVIVLAQASMARLLAALPEPPRVPVLTSPVSGLQAAGACLLG